MGLQVLGIDGDRVLLAQGYKVIAQFVNADFRHDLLGVRFRLSLRQIDLDVVGRRHGACHHEEQQQQDSTAYIALHADEDIAYKEVVRVLDIANQHKMKLVVATRNKK